MHGIILLSILNCRDTERIFVDLSGSPEPWHCPELRTVAESPAPGPSLPASWSKSLATARAPLSNMNPRKTSNPASPTTALELRLREIFASRNLTLYKISSLARGRYPRDSRYSIPRNLYFRLRSAKLTPTTHQLLALAELTGYRLRDWLAVFGLRLEEIPGWQALLERPRTTLIDPTADDLRASVPWFRELATAYDPPTVAPLSQLLGATGSRPLGQLLPENPRGYLYAKIGWQDALAFPELLAGSIVRANPQKATTVVEKAPGGISKEIFLVEHQGGYCCGRIQFNDGGRVALVTGQVPSANAEFRLGSDLKLLGVVDLEFRRLMPPRTTAPVASTEASLTPDLSRMGWLRSREQKQKRFSGNLFRLARGRAGLSLHQASDMSRRVATGLRDPRYFTSQASLSDYEAGKDSPRQIHKLISVCILYGLRLFDVLDSLGLWSDDTDLVSIPDHWLEPHLRVPKGAFAITQESPSAGRFLRNISEQMGEIPFFLRTALPPLVGLPELSLHDVFWVGGQANPLHPALRGALFVFVNRRKRRPRLWRGKSAWEQPLFLVRKRDGTYVLACCSFENHTILVHPFGRGFLRPQRLRNRVDADVMGQVVGILRSLPRPA